MSVPVQTQILDLMGARFLNISKVNGYFNDLKKLDRARLTPFKNPEMPGLNYYITGDTLDVPMNTGVNQRVMSVAVEFYTTTRDRPFSDVANELATDAIIALNRDPAAPTVADQDSTRLGKKVVKFETDTFTPAIGEGQTPYCGAVLIFIVTYRVSRQDPFTLIT